MENPYRTHHDAANPDIHLACMSLVEGRSLVTQIPSNRLPWSLEITPQPRKSSAHENQLMTLHKSKHDITYIKHQVDILFPTTI